MGRRGLVDAVCGGASTIDLTDPCIRALWTTALPALLVFALCFNWFVLPVVLPRVLKKTLRKWAEPFEQYLTLEEAVEIDWRAEGREGHAAGEDTAATHPPTITAENGTGNHHHHPVSAQPGIPLWRTLAFVFVGLVQCLGWLTLASYRFIAPLSEGKTEQEYWIGVLMPFGIALSWLYTVIRPVAKPAATPPFDVFTLYILFFGGATIKLGEMIYEHTVMGLAWPIPWVVGVEVANLVVVVLLIAVVMAMPLAIPGPLVNKDQIGKEVSPEDYTSLFGWITFNWVYPLVKRGRDNTLNEKDVWALSPTIHSRPIFIKFNQIRRSTLLWKLWAANSLDLILDFGLTFISVIFNYTGPFFLKRILDLIDLPNPTPETKARAYIYAFLAFGCTLMKAEADVQHLWFGRRAATRIRSELMAAIYDKALKRKDFSGIVDKQKVEETKKQADKAKRDAAEALRDAQDGQGSKARKKKQDKQRAKEEKEQAAKDDDPKAGADAGKIVNLMAGDANRISNMISGAYFIYGAPLEIVIAGTFLYQLLGLSAFAGFGILILGWPLNSFLARRSVRIQKGVLTARDKRMGVLNELIGAIKLIKFFAWEERWIDRAMDARNVEMGWMTKSRVNSILFYLLWTCAPILVSIISFFTYVMQGKELTVGTAFTAIALFGMIRAPLNVIPAWIVQILQTGVALKRIAVYLEEDEVSPQVSSLKRDDDDNENSPQENQYRFSAGGRVSGNEGGLGIVKGTFKWNEVEEKVVEDKKDQSEETAGRRRLFWSPSSRKAAGILSPTSTTSTSLTGSSTTTDASTSTEGTVTAARKNRDLEAGRSPTEDDNASITSESSRITEQKFELKDIDVIFPEGELTVVTGPTASGKTALLMALLGELTIISGRIILHKDPLQTDAQGFMQAISYAAQTPWLRHQSIKDNILFGFPYDEERYNEVLECCALNPDLKMLEDGDETEIGARGVSLSGGQKARVALARAVYARTKYVLLDDPLSAVDSHTARFLYDNLLLGSLLKNRTVILVTHHVDLVLPGAFYLVRMLDGRIDTQGKVQDLRDQGVLDGITLDAAVENASANQEAERELAEQAKKDVEAGQDPERAEDANAKGKKKPRKLVKDEHRETGGVKWEIYKSYLKASSYWIWGFLAFMVLVSQILSVSEKLWIKTWGEAYGMKDDPNPNITSPLSLYTLRSFAEQGAQQLDGFEYSSLAAVGGQWFAREHQHQLFHIVGTPSTLASSVMAARARVVANATFPVFHSTKNDSDSDSRFVFDAQFIAQSPETMSAVSFSRHASEVSAEEIKWPEFELPEFELPSARKKPLFYIGVYAAIGLASALASVVSVAAQYTAALRASKILFKKLLVTVVRATFRFHDTTPQGRMLNRFGKDIETIDTSLAGSLQVVNSSLASFFASILTVAFVFPAFLFPAIVIGFVYRELAIAYLNTGRDLRRMESNTRSPIFSDFGELLEGIVTVRAFSAERRFLDGLHKKIDLTTQMWYTFWMTNRWLLINFDALSAFAVLITTLFSISTLRDGAAGYAGLCITSAMAFTTSIYWACRFWTGLELDLNSVERIIEYLELPQEPPAVVEHNRVPAFWPSSARNDALISVENLTIKYAADLPAVLQDVSFSLKAGERVGLLGRTGSGKSTLAMSILRFVDPVEGRIIIDGIDISTIGLYELRSRLTFIPQDATLFSGTLRDNLDPFNEHIDAECNDVLRRVHMLNNEASRAPSEGPSRSQSMQHIPEATSDTFVTAVSSSSLTTVTTSTEVGGGKPTVTLDTHVSAGGTNFSQGQRQLIAMARALLRRSPIIVLDEATSSIDFKTDAMIQQTIREEFTDSLLLTVAHRLKTVIDYDRLIVLDKGHVVEFDTPWNLIQKENGIFRQMCLKSGTFQDLYLAAREKAVGVESDIDRAEVQVEEAVQVHEVQIQGPSPPPSPGADSGFNV